MDCGVKVIVARLQGIVATMSDFKTRDYNVKLIRSSYATRHRDDVHMVCIKGAPMS